MKWNYAKLEANPDYHEDKTKYQQYIAATPVADSLGNLGQTQAAGGAIDH